MHFTINLVMNFCSAQITAFPFLTKLQILFPDVPRDRGRVTDHNNTNSLPNSFWIMNGIFNMPYKKWRLFSFLSTTFYSLSHVQKCIFLVPCPIIFWLKANSISLSKGVNSKMGLSVNVREIFWIKIWAFDNMFVVGENKVWATITSTQFDS